MWLFDHFPKEQIAKTYGFTVPSDFIGHLERASVRFNNGGSGSFVSPRGLLFTNHHVGQDCIQKLSTAEHDYMANGFSAANDAGEKACPDLEVDALLSTTDVTAKVNEGIAADAPGADANRMRKASIAKIEKECTTSTGNRCDVVTFYSGVSTVSINTRSTRMCVWCLRLSSALRSLEAIRITLPTRATAWISRCSALMKMASL